MPEKFFQIGKRMNTNRLTNWKQSVKDLLHFRKRKQLRSKLIVTGGLICFFYWHSRSNPILPNISHCDIMVFVTVQVLTAECGTPQEQRSAPPLAKLTNFYQHGFQISNFNSLNHSKMASNIKIFKADLNDHSWNLSFLPLWLFILAVRAKEIQLCDH